MTTDPIETNGETFRVRVAGPAFPPGAYVAFMWRPRGQPRFEPQRVFFGPDVSTPMSPGVGEYCFAFSPGELRDCVTATVEKIEPAPKALTIEQRVRALEAGSAS